MGLLNFIKEVGEKLFGASEAKAATADELKKELDKHGLSAEGLDISVDGDKVTVKGSAASTEAAEKIVLALGNTVGVAQVKKKKKKRSGRCARRCANIPTSSRPWARPATRP